MNNIPSCHDTTPQAVRAWYTHFTAHISSSGYYIHPHWYFRPSVNSPTGFTCGYNTLAVTATAAVASSPYIPQILYVTPFTTSTPGVTPVVVGIKEVPTAVAVAAVAAKDAVFAVPAQQHDLPGLFQPRLQDLDNQLYIAFSKKNVFHKNLPQY